MFVGLGFAWHSRVGGLKATESPAFFIPFGPNWEQYQLGAVPSRAVWADSNAKSAVARTASAPVATAPWNEGLVDLRMSTCTVQVTVQHTLIGTLLPWYRPLGSNTFACSASTSPAYFALEPQFKVPPLDHPRDTFAHFRCSVTDLLHSSSAVCSERGSGEAGASATRSVSSNLSGVASILDPSSPARELSALSAMSGTTLVHGTALVQTSLSDFL